MVRIFAGLAAGLLLMLAIMGGGSELLLRNLETMSHNLAFISIITVWGSAGFFGGFAANRIAKKMYASYLLAPLLLLTALAIALSYPERKSQPAVFNLFDVSLIIIPPALTIIGGRFGLQSSKKSPSA